MNEFNEFQKRLLPSPGQRPLVIASIRRDALVRGCYDGIQARKGLERNAGASDRTRRFNSYLNFSDWGLSFNKDAPVNAGSSTCSHVYIEGLLTTILNGELIWYEGPYSTRVEHKVTFRQMIAAADVSEKKFRKLFVPAYMDGFKRGMTSWDRPWPATNPVRFSPPDQPDEE